MKCPKCQSDNTDTARFCSNCATPLPLSEEIPLSQTKTLQTPVQDLLKGTTFAGRYNLIEQLGRGGMGVVYKAEDTKLKRTVALKFLPPEITHIPEVKERFMREAQAAAALDHPNICTVHEFDEAEDKMYLSMAYIEGRDLRKKTESGPLELEQALTIAIQAAEGLQAAHKKGVIHRDIKSANIMVTESGQAKIMDFGLARMTEQSLLTQEGMAMGTVAYMSPEQAQGKEVDQRTDIWSLGVVLYEIFTGQLPFQGDREQAVVYSILKESPKPVKETRPEIPDSIGQVISKTLEKDPEDRYQQIDELLDDMKSISAGIVPEEIKIRLRKEQLRKRKRVISYAGIAGIIIFAAIIAFKVFMSPPAPIESIAVLPLENLTGDAEQEYFVDGITDGLIGQLGEISGLKRVISRTSVMRYKETDMSLSEIARELKVDAVVEGSVQLAGDSVRIRVQLIDALPEEQNLWGKTYEGNKSDVLMLYNEMTRAIVDEIKIELTPEEASVLAETRKVDPAAYDAYLRGQYHWNKFTPDNFDQAEQYFETALEIDPNYALAHTGIAWVWIGRRQYGLAMPSEATPKIRKAASKALELDDTLVEAHCAMASNLAWGEWEWEESGTSYQRAIELNPNYADARAFYSHYLIIMNRPDEGMAQIERALELDPFNPMAQGFHGMALTFLRRYDEAITVFQNVLKTEPTHGVAIANLYIALHLTDRHEEALETLKVLHQMIGLPQGEVVLTQGYEEGGFAVAITRMAEMWEEVFQVNYVSPGMIAEFYTFTGNKEKVLEWLQKGFEVRDPNIPYIGISPSFVDLLRDEPGYHELIRKIGLPPVE